MLSVTLVAVAAAVGLLRSVGLLTVGWLSVGFLAVGLATVATAIRLLLSVGWLSVGLLSVAAFAEVVGALGATTKRVKAASEA